MTFLAGCVSRSKSLEYHSYSWVGFGLPLDPSKALVQIISASGNVLIRIVGRLHGLQNKTRA